MKIDAILKADVLDIIFENRNKDYGAYTLRKFYNNRLYKALGAMLAVVALLCSFTFIKSTTAISNIPFVDTGFTVKKIYAIPQTPDKPKEIIKPNQPAQPKQLAATKEFTTNMKIVSDNKAAIIDDLNDNDIIADATKKGDPGVVPKVKSNITEGTDSSAFVEPKKPQVDINKPYDVVEVMPTFPGGMEALRKFLKNNLQAPEDIQEGETVSVKIKFIVGYDGVLKGFETVEDGGKAFNNEVIRVLKKMPEWTPGKTKGEKVSVYYTIPVKFTPTE